MATRITKKDKHNFCNGDCQVLAQELSKLTGWTISALGEGEHVFVYDRETDKAFDINGLVPLGQLIRTWRTYGFDDHELYFVENWMEQTDGSDMAPILTTPGRAEKIAKKLVADYLGD